MALVQVHKTNQPNRNKAIQLLKLNIKAKTQQLFPRRLKVAQMSATIMRIITQVTLPRLKETGKLAKCLPCPTALTPSEVLPGTQQQ